MKQIRITISEARALLILNEFLQSEQVEGSHRFNDYLPLIETSIRSITERWIETPRATYDPFAKETA